jgi:AcrR family transcriptional regulator
MNETSRKPSARTRETRAKLIATAEQLFAERGVDSVSLNEITRAAEQKNRNAVHYHFGSKEALIQAIFEKHWQPIGALRREMLAEMEEHESITLESIASALVLPVAARFDDTDGGLAYIKISAQLAATNTLQFFSRGVTRDDGGDDDSATETAADRDSHSGDMTQLWAPFLQPLPPAVRTQRMSLIVGMLFHGLADHAVYRDQGKAGLANTELMVSNLIDSICAVLRAPVSAQTLARCTQIPD